MKIDGKEGRALWFENGVIKFIDQRKLPYKLEYYTAKTVDECAFAIKEMVVRGRERTARPGRCPRRLPSPIRSDWDLFAPWS